MQNLSDCKHRQRFRNCLHGRHPRLMTLHYLHHRFEDFDLSMEPVISVSRIHLLKLWMWEFVRANNTVHRLSSLTSFSTCDCLMASPRDRTGPLGFCWDDDEPDSFDSLFKLTLVGSDLTFISDCLVSTLSSDPDWENSSASSNGLLSTPWLRDWSEFLGKDRISGDFMSSDRPVDLKSFPPEKWPWSIDWLTSTASSYLSFCNLCSFSPIFWVCGRRKKMESIRSLNCQNSSWKRH